MTLLAALALAVGVATPAAGAALWPTYWNPLTLAGADYSDPVGDENPEATDLVGGLDGGTSFAAGFSWLSEADDQLSLRMRLDEDGDGKNSVWQFLFETDGDLTTIDWVLEVRQSGNPSGRQVIFTPTTSGGPTFNDLAMSSTFAWTGALADWSRWGAAGDGSNFDGDPDAFLDVAIPLSVFRAATGLSLNDGFRLALSTSTSHTQVNKDLPLALLPTDLVGAAFTESVPEPGTGGLTAMGLVALGVRRRRRHARSGAA